MPPAASVSPTATEKPAGLLAGIALNGHRALDSEIIAEHHPQVIGNPCSAGEGYSRLEELLEVNRRKDELLATVCHELRSPLASICNAIGVLLKSGDEDPTVRAKMLELIERQARQMNFLAAGLLDVSRFTCGQMHLQRGRIDLRAVLCNALETLEPDFERRRQRLTTAWPESSVWVLADAGRLEQVFVNLLSNASKYTDDDGEIALSMEACHEGAVVRVRDSGIGIASDMLPHVFELFKQADPSASRSKSGLGVGLSLVRSMVQAHGGSVAAHSAGLGQGSEFIIRLPCIPHEYDSEEGLAG